VVAEAASSSPTHEVMSTDAIALSDATIGTCSPQPQGEAMAASTDDDDDIMEEPDVILGHPSLKASGNVSLGEQWSWFAGCLP
jgi:hypothetical protein